MKLVRFEPWTIADFVPPDAGRGAYGRPSQAAVADWRPAVDIIEEKDRFLLLADIPGVNAEDIAIQADNGILSVSGERNRVRQGESEGIRHSERASGRFSRRFTLPDSADTDGITANMSNGTLEIVIPKSPAVQARRITVEAA